MKGCTTGKDICTELINCENKKLAYSFTNLVAICTEGAPAICGKHTGTILSKKNKAKMLVNILLKRFAFTLKASSVT